MCHDILSKSNIGKIVYWFLLEHGQLIHKTFPCTLLNKKAQLLSEDFSSPTYKVSSSR